MNILLKKSRLFLFYGATLTKPWSIIFNMVKSLSLNFLGFQNNACFEHRPIKIKKDGLPQNHINFLKRGTRNPKMKL